MRYQARRPANRQQQAEDVNAEVETESIENLNVTVGKTAETAAADKALPDFSRVEEIVD